MSLDLENWMRELNDHFKGIPFITLAIPGSHDSMSYGITRKSEVAPDSKDTIKRLIKVFGFVIRPIVHNWCVTQKANVLQQLEIGIRYFDIRLATKRGSSDFFFVHGLYGPAVTHPFNEILKFLVEHPSEVIILDLQHFYEFNIDDHKKLINFIKTLFKNIICPCPKGDISEITLNWLNERNYQVIVIYRNKLALEENLVWPSWKWPTPWPQTMSQSTLIKFLSDKLNARPKNAGFVSQCVLTPDNKTVLLSPLSTLEKKCAIPAAQVVLPWIANQQSGLLNVCIADFIEKDNASFSKTVLRHNFI